MDIITEIYISGITRYKTHCCALSQLSISNDNSLNEIKDVINKMKNTAIQSMNPHQIINYGSHERAAFVITLPEETNLVKNLQELGFEEIAEFHRRNCYPEDSFLKMWILSW